MTTVQVDYDTALEIAKHQYEKIIQDAGTPQFTKRRMSEERRYWIGDRAQFIERQGARPEWLESIKETSNA